MMAPAKQTAVTLTAVFFALVLFMTCLPLPAQANHPFTPAPACNATTVTNHCSANVPCDAGDCQDYCQIAVYETLTGCCDATLNKCCCYQDPSLA